MKKLVGNLSKEQIKKVLKESYRMVLVGFIVSMGLGWFVFESINLGLTMFSIVLGITVLYVFLVDAGAEALQLQEQAKKEQYNFSTLDLKTTFRQGESLIA